MLTSRLIGDFIRLAKDQRLRLGMTTRYGPKQAAIYAKTDLHRGMRTSLSLQLVRLGSDADEAGLKEIGFGDSFFFKDEWGYMIGLGTAALVNVSVELPRTGRANLGRRWEVGAAGDRPPRSPHLLMHQHKCTPSAAYFNAHASRFLGKPMRVHGVKILEPIHEGQEVFVSYGEDYCK
jgi:hypothetical protein